jgi:hypothetical protein
MRFRHPHIYFPHLHISAHLKSAHLLFKPVNPGYSSPLVRIYHLLYFAGMENSGNIKRETGKTYTYAKLLAKNKSIFCAGNFQAIGVIAVKKSALYGGIVNNGVYLRFIVKKQLLFV